MNLCFCVFRFLGVYVFVLLCCRTIIYRHSTFFYLSYFSKNRFYRASDFAYSCTFLSSVVSLSVCLSVCLSSITFVYLLKTLDGFECHLAGTFCGVQWHIVFDGGPWPPGEQEIYGQTQPKHTAQPDRQSYAATWRTGTRIAIPPFAKSLWCLFTTFNVIFISSALVRPLSVRV